MIWFSRVLTIALGLLFFTGSMTLAQSIGLDFKSMPVGTKAHYVDDLGRKFTYRYSGSYGAGKGKRYIIQVEGSRSYQRLYNSAGFLVAMRHLDFQFNYRPYFCTRKLGACRFFYDNDYSPLSGSWNTIVKKTSSGYHAQMRPKNKNRKEVANFYYKLGRFNFFSEFVAGDNWERLIKVTTP